MQISLSKEAHRFSDSLMYLIYNTYYLRLNRHDDDDGNDAEDAGNPEPQDEHSQSQGQAHGRRPQVVQLQANRHHLLRVGCHVVHDCASGSGKMKYTSSR